MSSYWPDNIPVTNLVGDPLENFYQLGVKDREGYKITHQMMLDLAKLNKFAPFLTKLIKAFPNRSSCFPVFDRYVESYAEGLQICVEDYLLDIMLPEFMSAFSKWKPDALSLLFGCSSLMAKDPETQEIYHGRILDFPLVGHFDQFERIVTYDFPGQFKVMSYGTQGMPFPSLTVMNEHGLSIAVHQKYNHHFSFSGQPIAEIVYYLISNCKNTGEVKHALKSCNSITMWGLYCCDKTGNVLTADICGKQIIKEQFSLDDHQFLYFNNMHIKKYKEHAGPVGFEDYCQMRSIRGNDQTKKVLKSHKKDFENSILKSMSLVEEKKGADAKDWNLGPSTLSSLQIICFNNSKFQTSYTPGPAPKQYKGSSIKVSNLFEKPLFEALNSKTKTNPKFLEGLRRLSKAQNHFDLGNHEKAYHEIQMGIKLTEDTPWEIIGQFFFVVWQYINCKDNEEFKFLITELETLNPLLPEYLQQQNYLFISRIQTILKLPVRLDGNLITHPILKKYYQTEKNLKPFILKQMRRFIFPRLEGLDIYYGY